MYFLVCLFVFVFYLVFTLSQVMTISDNAYEKKENTD